MDVFALIVAGLALAFSVYSFFREDRLNRRLAAIEEARREDEVSSRLRADVTAEFNRFVNSRGHTAYQLTLANRGPARAEDVTFEILTPEKGDAPFPHMEGHKFPIALDPGQSYSVMIVIVLGTAPAVDVELRWTDPAGEQQKTLNLSVYG